MSLRSVISLIAEINVDGSTLPLPFVRPVSTSTPLLMIQAWKAMAMMMGYGKILGKTLYPPLV
jgi:hypothetical protein